MVSTHRFLIYHSNLDVPPDECCSAIRPGKIYFGCLEDCMYIHRSQTQRLRVGLGSFPCHSAILGFFKNHSKCYSAFPLQWTHTHGTRGLVLQSCWLHLLSWWCLKIHPIVSKSMETPLLLWYTSNLILYGPFSSDSHPTAMPQFFS